MRRIYNGKRLSHCCFPKVFIAKQCVAYSTYVEGNEFLGDDDIIVMDSNIEFSKFSKEIIDISKDIRKNIQLNIINDELIISGDLDLGSNGDTINVNLRGKNELIQKDEPSVLYYELEGIWDRDIIRVRLTPYPTFEWE